MTDPSTVQRLVVVGCGFVGSAVCRAALRAGHYGEVLATTRDPARTAVLSSWGAVPLVLLQPDATPPAHLVEGADVVITYPPDPVRDPALAAVCRAARAVVYVSSSAVYGATRGHIDDTTPAAPDHPLGTARLAAEETFRAAGAVALRAPGIYGPERGLHRRLLEGKVRLSGTGGNHICRIHVEDLAGLCLAALVHGAPGQAHVVADLRPTTQRRAVAYLCERLHLPMPPSEPLAATHPTLRGDRSLDPSIALVRLQYRLRYPTYRDGFDDALRRIEALSTLATASGVALRDSDHRTAGPAQDPR